MAKNRRWVIKAGSKMVCDGGPLLMRAWMLQVAQLKKKYNIDVIWVTSGAIAWAVARTNFKATKRTLPQKQALSAIGQPLVMDQYVLALQSANLLGSQVLLTAGDMKDPVRRKNLQNTLSELVKMKVIPILNENDAVATEEIKFGDNDSLAAKVAVMMKAERVVLMTDVEGLFDSDPNKNPDATLVRYRPKVGKAEFALADRKSISKVGTGGMYSKLLAAETAGKNKIITHLVKGDIPNNLLHIAQGTSIGTQFGGRDALAK
ncbi:glutamate 5-kinase [Bdellovibrio sp. ZAP7]|uniref:glutamate 5-kinase n=1 Tax=Bdellovibrio sp. ZAP7 TaxID=2231053 RepID=UPI00115B7118|nr:glutamate 5-kinase [Bdellovibrio sp. ZAP7]QDK45829.1 glutamate 5-kinase [Bdellovibrio sp. ZAP7]